MGNSSLDWPDSAGTRLTISVVAFKSDRTIGACLSAIATFAPYAAICVVDNSACQKTEEIVRSFIGRGLQVTFLSMESNVGYARANNYALSKLPVADFHLILNPDVNLTCDPMDLVPHLSSSAIVAGVLPSSAIGDYDFIPNARARPTLYREFKRALFGSKTYSVYQFPRDGPPVLKVDQLDGAFLLMRQSFFKSHPFDERFELYYEDVRLCDLARRSGGCAVVRTVCGIHLGGASAKRQVYAAFVVHRISRLRYLRLTFPRIPPIIWYLQILLELLCRSVTGQSEGLAVRKACARSSWKELCRPGSVEALGNWQRNSCT